MSLVLVANDFVGDAAFTGFGQVAPVKRKREWRSDGVQYDNWQEQFNQVSSRPRRHWFINWAVLDEAARDKLVELFDAARGRYDSFLWLDDKEYLASGELITTDGSETQYQLQCTYYSGEDYEWTEDKKDIVPGATYAPVVSHSVDGAQTEVAAPPVNANEFSLDDATGIMTWPDAHPPSAGVLTVTFQYYFRVRFAADVFDDLQERPGLWNASDLHIVERIS